MSGATVLAVGAVSAFGTGHAAYRVAMAGQRARVAISVDEPFARAGFARPVAARVTSVLAPADDRATALLSTALDQCLSRLGEIRPSWRSCRVGLVMGTSSGGMLTAQTLFAAHAGGERITSRLARGATYFAPLEAATAAMGVTFAPRVLLLGACASSTLALGLALRWLALGRCDIALAGGFDAMSEFVASGFEALRATTATLPRPFRLARDGMALGEGAGVVALELAQKTARDTSFPALVGFAATTDAVHLTAPDRTGHGLGRAAELALADARLPAEAIGIVSAHATATPFNDVAEAQAIRRVFGDRGPSVVFPFKAQIGHALGAAGVLESLALLDAVAQEIAPAAAGDGAIDPECAVPLLDASRAAPSAPSLKLSSAFGGANAALVFAPRAEPSPPVVARPVYLHVVHTIGAALDGPAFAARMRDRHPNLPRLDLLAKLVLSVVDPLAMAVGASALEGGGMILGHTLATLEQNALFDARRRERGPRSVEPRRFPATSPNAAAGECAIAFRLTGPTFAVGGSLHGGLEALSVARDLVAARDAETMLVVAADLSGPLSSALLDAASGPAIEQGACAALLTALPTLGAASSTTTAIELHGEVPRALGGDSDWIWTGPAGHAELAMYLRGLRSPK
jgi:3-oxoacyl-[acyl-carrier-protein] synthase-1/3-oxoacyl-[acyl-carrier-protein] synthase II